MAEPEQDYDVTESLRGCLKAALAAFKKENSQLIEALDVVQQMVAEHCEYETGDLDSQGNMANAEAMRLLKKHGRLVKGRRNSR